MAKAPEPSATATPAEKQADDPARTAPPKQRVTVAAGRSVMHPVHVGTKLDADGKEVPRIVHRTAGPGETIEVSPEDAAMLAANGSLHLTAAASAAATPPPATPTTVPTTTINGDDGSIIRPG